jgi:uncharacterized protein (DUF1810 family)
MPLFAKVLGAEAVFKKVLEKYFDGAHDPNTHEIIRCQKPYAK